MKSSNGIGPEFGVGGGAGAGAGFAGGATTLYQAPQASGNRSQPDMTYVNTVTGLWQFAGLESFEHVSCLSLP